MKDAKAVKDAADKAAADKASADKAAAFEKAMKDSKEAKDAADKAAADKAAKADEARLKSEESNKEIFEEAMAQAAKDAADKEEDMAAEVEKALKLAESSANALERWVEFLREFPEFINELSDSLDKYPLVEAEVNKLIKEEFTPTIQTEDKDAAYKAEAPKDGSCKYAQELEDLYGNVKHNIEQVPTTSLLWTNSGAELICQAMKSVSELQNNIDESVTENLEEIFYPDRFGKYLDNCSTKGGQDHTKFLKEIVDDTYLQEDIASNIETLGQIVCDDA
jgi:hypothetical protein